jgi:hypothetical protein
MESMPSLSSPQARPGGKWRRPEAARQRRGVCVAVLFAGLAVVALFATGCQRLHHTDTRPLDQAGMWFASIEELRKLDVTDAEVAQLTRARQAGMSDASCVELLRIARARKQPFSSGDAAAGLRQVGVSESTVLELARLNQLGLWSGESQAMHLAGLSDRILLAVARRHAAGQDVPSGSALAQLRDAGMTETELLALIDHGTSDQQAQAMLEAHRRAVSRTGFVHYHRRRRR